MKPKVTIDLDDYETLKKERADAIAAVQKGSISISENHYIGGWYPHLSRHVTNVIYRGKDELIKRLEVLITDLNDRSERLQKELSTKVEEMQDLKRKIKDLENANKKSWFGWLNFDA